MITSLRQQFNSNFEDKNYQSLLNWVESQYNYRPPFRIAETPVFIPHKLKNQLIEACEEITDVIVRSDFKERSQGAVLAGQEVPNETEHTTFLQMDFGICKNANGELKPQLIEVQGFPSLYFFQDLIARGYKKHYNIDDKFTHLFGGLNSSSYIELLRNAIIGDHNPENVILLEIEPEKQVTAIDFIAAKHSIGIEPVCVSDLIVRGKDVFYEKEGKEIRVERIFNRVIFDELIKRDDLQREFYFTHEHNVSYVGHPNWFFRISKHTLPLIDSQYVPKSYFLNELDEWPTDLHNYVLKPLYSFAGTGVIININRHDLEGIKDPENYILQRKVEYAPVVTTPSEPSKCEIRMLMLWEKGAPRPVIVNNLARLSKGLMVGVRYNKNKDWVGGSVGFFED
ncbi:MAG: hypothetical protein MI974_25245 [Chitinophagales bacterium]|nr:hypothetical protein [Chitinophagales bacterium]